MKLKFTETFYSIIKYYKMNSNTYDNLINQIKGFKYKLIPNEELRERYKKYGLCKECSQPRTGGNLVTPNVFNKILTNGLVAIKKLMNLYKDFN